jgi:hypothetical protein
MGCALGMAVSILESARRQPACVGCRPCLVSAAGDDGVDADALVLEGPRGGLPAAVVTEVVQGLALVWAPLRFTAVTALSYPTVAPSMAL